MSDARTAVVLATARGAATVVGGLPLAARAALALRAAGFEDVAILAAGDADRIARPLDRRGAGVRRLATAGVAAPRSAAKRVLVLRGDVLVDAEALAPLRRAAWSGPVTVPIDGRTRTIGALGGSDELSLLLATAATDDAAPDAGPERPSGLTLTAGLAVPLTGTTPDALERRLLDDLGRHTRAADGYLSALIDRRLSRAITRVLLPTLVSPHAITWASIALGLLGAAGLATLDPGLRVAAVLALIASTVLDCVDGEIARARLEQSASGARLDLLGDYLVHLATFAGLAVGLARQGLPPGGRLALVTLLSGVAVAMAVMHVLVVRPAVREGDLHRAAGADDADRSLIGVAEKLASRDYAYLLLALAAAGRLEWFVYAAALGSWVLVAILVGERVWAAPARRRALPSP